MYVIYIATKSAYIQYIHQYMRGDMAQILISSSIISLLICRMYSTWFLRKLIVCFGYTASLNAVPERLQLSNYGRGGIIHAKWMRSKASIYISLCIGSRERLLYSL